MSGRGETVNAEGLNPDPYAGSNPAARTTHSPSPDPLEEIRKQIEQPVPTERGYYFARRKKIGELEIKPVYVCDYGDKLVVWSIGNSSMERPEFFAWFGPIPAHDELSAARAEIEGLRAEVQRLRNILNEEALIDPELPKLSGRAINVFDVAASEEREFDPAFARPTAEESK